MSLEQIKEARRRIANAGGISEMVDGGGCYVSIPGEKAATLPIPELLAEWGDGGRRLTTAGHSSPAATQSVPTFAQALELAILETIRREKRQGTVSMSLECLKQCTRPPSDLCLPGAPCGANARWMYSNVFANVCNANKTIRRFIRS